MKKDSLIFKKLLITAALAASTAAFSGCNGGETSPMSEQNANADILQPGTPNHAQTPSQNGNAGDGSTPPVTASQMKIAVKYVALKETSSAAASPTQAEVETLLENMSKLWVQCNIKFVLEAYETPVASENGLDYYPANQSQLDAMRSKYDDRKHALLVKTGLWNRSGDLGADGSNGFSTLPPDNPEGAVFEDWVATNALLISHETGHLLGGLDHTSDTTNLMNHYVTTSTTKLSQDQCEEARSAMQSAHAGWIR